MKDTSLNKSDRYLIFLFYLIAIPVTISGYDYSKGLFVPFADTIVYVLFSFLVSYIIVYKFFPFFFPKKKIMLLFLTVVPFMAIMGILEIASYRWITNSDLTKLYSFESIYWGITTSAENAGILIGILLGKKFYDAQIDIQKKEKEKKESELRLLKEQIDPHFLFNNLNTVDSLIDSNPSVAKEYLNQLAKMYRYLIRTKDDDVVGLEEELIFTKNYIYLIEKRFGSAFKFEINQKIDLDSKLIPPAALQSVLENVVKHNAASVEEPILSKITIDAANITITNDFRKKPSSADNHGTGLLNLKTRYSYLTDQKIIIDKGQDYFKIVLPVLNLIENENINI